VETPVMIGDIGLINNPQNLMIILSPILEKN